MANVPPALLTPEDNELLIGQRRQVRTRTSYRLLGKILDRK